MLSATLLVACTGRAPQAGDSVGVGDASEVATASVSSSWATRQIIPREDDDMEGPQRAGDDGVVAWRQAGVLYQAAEATRPVRVTREKDFEFTWDIKVKGRRVFWTTTESLDQGDSDSDRWSLFTWAPGNKRPTRLYTVLTPREIGDLQVRGDRILFSTKPADDYDPQNEDVGSLGSDQPHEWVLLSLRSPGRSLKLPIGRNGAQAVLTDRLVAWSER